MALAVNNNIASLNAQHQLMGTSRNALSQVFERLASGHRINSARDDAAGLAVAARMAAQVGGAVQAMRNTNDGISLAQTAEGAMSQVSDSLQRMRELAVQASNGTYSDADRAAIQAQASAHVEEIDRIAKHATFNGQKVLDGSFAGATFQVGPNAGDVIAVGEMGNTTAAALGQSAAAPQGLRSIQLDTAAGAADALAVIDSALDQVNAQRGQLGAVQNRFESSIGNMQVSTQNLSAARARIDDVDFGEATSRLSQLQLKQQSTVAMLAQANAAPQMVLALLRG